VDYINLSVILHHSVLTGLLGARGIAFASEAPHRLSAKRPRAVWFLWALLCEARKQTELLRKIDAARRR
jgi:hypothetical protein